MELVYVNNRPPWLNNVAAVEEIQSDLDYCFFPARMEATAEG